MEKIDMKAATEKEAEQEQPLMNEWSRGFWNSPFTKQLMADRERTEQAELKTRKKLKLEKTEHEKQQLAPDAWYQKILRSPCIVRLVAERKKADEMLSEMMQRASKLKTKAALFTSERKHAQCASEDKKLRVEVKSLRGDLDGQYAVARRTAETEAKAALRDNQDMVENERKAISQALKEKREMYLRCIEKAEEDAAMALRAAREKYEKRRRVITEELSKKLEAAKTKAYNQRSAIDDKHTTTSTELAPKRKNLQEKMEEVKPILDGICYQMNRKIWEDQRKVERAQLDQKAKMEREVSAKKKAEEMRARDKTRKRLLDKRGQMVMANAKMGEERQVADEREHVKALLRTERRIVLELQVVGRSKEMNQKLPVERKRRNELILPPITRPQENCAAKRRETKAGNMSIHNILPDRFELPKVSRSSREPPRHLKHH